MDQQSPNSSATGARSFERARKDYNIWSVIIASAAGTMIEWYDFYIFGSLAVIISPLFYPPGNDTLAMIAYLATFAVGFIVRPFGALFFGRIGDLVGRKYAFLVTLLLMGTATAAVGFLPTYHTIGLAAPVFLILIRVVQGLALGGESFNTRAFKPNSIALRLTTQKETLPQWINRVPTLLRLARVHSSAPRKTTTSGASSSPPPPAQ